MNGPLAMIIALFIILGVLDCWLYCKVVDRHGPQWKVWPGSGFYVAWKYRDKQLR
jgi:hypothetical protein